MKASEHSKVGKPQVPAAETKPLPARLLRAVRDMDRAAVGVTLLLAFFLVSFPIRNSDYLLHLATGRALFQGQYWFGSDPFAHTTSGVFWVNHAWLYDALAYLLHLLGGATALVIAKGLLFAILAWVCLNTGRCGRSWWLPAVCVALALLPIGSEARIGPMCVSMLFLALTLWFLQKGGGWNWRESEAPADSRPLTWKAYWPLLPLFFFWVNLDEWFLLGPLTVALYLLGQYLQQRQKAERDNPSTRPGEIKALGCILGLGLAVCLVNPHHVFVFRLPVLLGLGEVARDLRGDRTLSSLFWSPFQDTLYLAPLRSPARLAFFPLAVLMVASFALNFRQIRFWRLLIGGLFLFLALARFRLIPFFAVVAAPILALNLQEFATRRFGVGPLVAGNWRGWAIAGRFLFVLAVLGVIVCAWPGWVYAPLDERQVAWRSGLDPTMEKLAQWLREQHQRLPGTRGLGTHPDVGNYLAWYCPEEKGFVDGRYALFSRQLSDYVSLRRLLISLPQREQESLDQQWQELLEKNDIDRVIMYNQNPDTLRTPLIHFLIGPARSNWALVYLDSHVAVFGSTTRPAPGAYRPLVMNLGRDAMRPAEGEKAPDSGSPRLPLRYIPPESLWKSGGDRPPDADRAGMHIVLFDLLSFDHARRTLAGWYGSAASMTVAGINHGIPLGVLPSLSAAALAHLTNAPSERQARAREGEVIRFTSDEAATAKMRRTYRFLQNQQTAPELQLLQTPPELLLLPAIRFAWRAVAASPDHEAGYQRLAEAYDRWRFQTPEFEWQSLTLSRGSPAELRQNQLFQIRHVQQVSALRQLIYLKPDHEEAHLKLFENYARVGFLDLAVAHLRQYVRLTTAAGLKPRERPEDFKNRIENLRKRLESLESALKNSIVTYENRKGSFRSILEQSLGALERGLGEEALKVLMNADPKDFGTGDAIAAGIDLQIELGLLTGRLRDERGTPQDVRNWMSVEGLENRLGINRFRWFKTLLALATGNYKEADQLLAEISREPTPPDWPKIIEESLGVKNWKPANAGEGLATAAGLLIGRQLLDALTTRHYVDVFSGYPFLELYPSAQERARAELGYRALLGYLGSRSARANLLALRGLLALEWGETARAREHFQAAIRENVPFAFRQMAEDCEQLLSRE